MATIPKEYRQIFIYSLLPREGGYVPERREGTRVIDPETFLGLTINEWVPAIVNMSAADVRALPDNVEARVLAIRAAQGSERRALTSAFIKDGARLTDPFGPATTQPDSGMPLRSLHVRASDNSPTDDATLGTMVEMAFGHYYTKYVTKPGFDRYPAAIRDEIIDFGVNGGIPRARWAAVKAMYEAGIISTEEYQSFPVITSAQANNRDCFSTKPGSAYSSSDVNNRILEHLRDATPAQLDAMEARYLVWQRTYYKELVREDASFRPYYDGWMARTSGGTAYAAATPPPAPRAPATRTPAAPATAPLLANAEYGIEVQYRDNLISAAIAIDLPGAGVVTYDVNRDTDRLTNVTSRPAGVAFWPNGRMGVTGGMNVAALPANSFSWVDDAGIERSLTVTPQLNDAIQKAGITRTLDRDLPAPLAFTIVDGELAGRNDLLFTSGKMEVRDVQTGRSYPAGTPAQYADAGSPPRR